MLDRLQETLREGEVNLTREGYELKFLGKSYAKYLTSTRTETVIVPDLEHNAEAANAESENLYIVGDNLDALKHLLGSYAGQIKCIYIDPPYNTGSDGFVYVDDFGFTAKDLVEKVGLDGDEAERVMALQGKSSHSAWLTFMYPRLELAKELLTEDGVILVSIDENEYSNLELLLDEIFGVQNSIATLIWQKKRGGGNDSVHVATEHEYVVMMSRSIEALPPMFTPYDDAYLKRYKERDERGRYYWDTFRRKSGKQYYPIVCPDGTVLEYDENGNRISWLRSESTFAQNLNDGEARFQQRKDGSWSVQFKQRLPAGKKPRSLLKDVGTTSTGAEDIENLFPSNVFDNPKPVSLIQTLVGTVAGNDDLIMDFFSGSATTAESVMRLNSVGGRRRYILVQLEETIDSSRSEASRNAISMGYKTIDQLGRERVRRAAESVRLNTAADIDYGFKLFRLERPTRKTLDELDAFDPTETNVLLSGDYVSKFAIRGAPGFDVVLATWLLQDGYGLTPTLDVLTLGDYELQVCEDSGYVIEPGLESADVMALVTKLEAGDLDLKRLVIFGYSVPFSVMHELRQNLKSLRSGQSVSVIERY